MARWWKRWETLAGGLVLVAGWWTPVFAQGPGFQAPMPPPSFQAPMPQPSFPGSMPPSGPMPLPGQQPAPYMGPSDPIGFPTQPPGGPPPGPGSGGPPGRPASSPLTLSDNGRPNAFNEEEYYPDPTPYVFKLKGEYLFWRVGKAPLSAIVATTSNSPDLTTGVGAIGDPGTVPLLGPGNYDYREMHGGRFTLGVAPGILPPVEISGFWIGKEPLDLLNESSNGGQNSRVLSRPFQAPNLPSQNNLGQEVVLSGGFPGLLSGGINVSADMSLWGLETNLFLNLGNSDVAGLDVILGYRFTRLSEQLDISNTLRTLDEGQATLSFNPVNPNGLGEGFTTIASDRFATRNEFHGGTIGLRPALYVGQFTTTVDLKLALGTTSQNLNVAGESVLISPSAPIRDPQTVPGGLLAVKTNSGAFSRDVFTVIPELNVNVGFNLARSIKLFATYNIFYWSSVIRPGDQLDNRVDSRQVPTDPLFDPTAPDVVFPRRSFFTRDFWGHGLSLGVEIGF